MLQLSQYIVKTIIKGIRPNVQKNLFRVDGYEDLRIYAHVCQGVNDYCTAHGFTLIAKLAKAKYDRLSTDPQAEYEANWMKNSDYVDEENHMTSYRNTIPDNDEKVVVLLLGTDEVDDKGGLNDFFVIDPAYIDKKVGNKYSELMSRELMSTFEYPEKAAEIINHFCRELFSVVPKDLFKISSQMDKWVSIPRSEEEIIEELYESLPAWGIPVIRDVVRATSVNSFVANTQPRILTKAHEFISGKLLDQSKSIIQKIEKAFNKYVEEQKRYATEYPAGQRIPTLESLKQEVIKFVSGHTDTDTINNLMYTDFSIFNDVLSLKTKKVPPPSKSKTVSGDPLKVLLSIIMNTFSSKKEPADSISFSFNRATVTGIPAGLDSNEKKARILSAWKRVTYFTGGIFDFIKEEEWHNIEGAPVSIAFTPADFFRPNNAESQYNEGVISSVSNGYYKIEFNVSASYGGDDVFVQDYVWKINPQDEWVVAFELFDEMPNLSSYNPYAVIKNINEAYYLKDSSGFEYWIDSANINFLYGDSDIIRVVQDRLHLEEDNEEISHLYRLGQMFQNFRQDVMNNGFFTTLKTSAVKLFDEYVNMAKRIENKSSYSSNLKFLLNAFIYLFTITMEKEVQYKSGRVSQVIVPPWHPATLEKIADRMLFVRAGMKEWNDDTTTNSSADSRLNALFSLASIQSATDAFPVSPVTMQPFSRTYGYYTLYGQPVENSEFTSSHTIMRKEAVFDDDFDEDDLRTMTSEAKLLLRVIRSYVKTYSNARNNLSIAIVNPSDLQIVISAIYQFANERKAEIEKSGKEGILDKEFLSITLTVITNDDNHGDRTYLAYWINNSFSTDEDIDVKAYLKVYTNESEIPKLFDSPVDVTIWFDALNTNRKATYKFDRTVFAHERLLDCRYPMVFKPAITMKNFNEHRIDITQPQFRVATEHTQVLRVFSDAQSDNRYNLVQSSEMDTDRGIIIRETQKKTIWLVCIDNAMDKRAVRDLYAYDTGIIGFTTGEGSYGQMNMAITCHKNVASDMQPRCVARLKKIFPKWTDTQLKSAAKNCIDKARRLDGVSILKAMNLHDYEMNNYLAYLIADAITEPNKKTLHVLIRLDSYPHWFERNSNKDDDKKIPDFLLLDADIQENGKLHLYAKVIESKISTTYGIDGHIDKAEKQISYGMKKLKQHFNPDDKSVERRYWLAQLYRAIAFLQSDTEYDDFTFNEINKQMNKMLEAGDYEIEWSAMILANIVDSNTFVDVSNYTSSAGDNIELLKVGQLAMQNILMNRDINASDVVFDDAATFEEEGTVAEVSEEPEDSSFTDETEGDSNEGEMPSIQIDETHDAEDHKEEEKTDETPAHNVEEEHEEQPEEQPDASEDHNGDSVDTGDSATEPETIPAASNIQDIRVLIGTDKRNNKVYWEYGNSKLANRHILITGGSGQGKTYAIETFLSELAKQGISSVIFDYTDGFLMEHLEKPFRDQLDGRIDEKIAIRDGIPVNPFKIREGLGRPGIQIAQAAGRLSAIMKHVYGFGDQQASAIYGACKEGIEKYKENMDFNKLRDLLKAQGTSFSKTVLSKMQQFFDMDLFDVHDGFDWNDITAGGGKITIIQLTQLDREMQTAITEMLLWDAWYSIQALGEKNIPFVVVLDEAQNLSFAEGSPAQKILQEGRKFGWSAWFATQFLKGAMTSDEISRLQQAAETLYFKPSSEETASIASMLSDQTHSQGDWVETLKKLQKGHCVVKADRIGNNGVFGSYPPVEVKVSSFEDRT